MDSFSYIHFIWQLKLKYVLFYQFNANISTFAAKECLVQLLSMALTLKLLAENCMKNWWQKLKKTCWHHAQVILHSGFDTTFLCTGQWCRNTCRVCKNFKSLPYLPGITWAASWQKLIMPYANNKDSDQPAHLRSLAQLRSLISTFIAHCLHSIKPILAKSKISRL